MHEVTYLHWKGQMYSRLSLQCGIMRIFLPLRFYVKSKLSILEPKKLPFQHIKKALNFDFNEFLHFVKAENDQRINIQSLQNCKNGILGILESHKLFSRKICVA